MTENIKTVPLEKFLKYVNEKLSLRQYISSLENLVRSQQDTIKKLLDEKERQHRMEHGAALIRRLAFEKQVPQEDIVKIIYRLVDESRK